jgi:hypothetical protein
VANQRAVLVDHADVLVGDEQTDSLAGVGPAEADVVEAAEVADGHAAGGVAYARSETQSVAARAMLEAGTGAPVGFGRRSATGGSKAATTTPVTRSE